MANRTVYGRFEAGRLLFQGSLLQEPVMEFDRTPSAIREELCDEPFDQVDGYIDVPNTPGLGIHVNESVVQRLSVAHERYS